jgi:hypothetical protein
MVEADSHLKLLPIIILDMYKVFEHINMRSIGLRDIRLGDELDGDYDKIDKDENDVDAKLLCCILYACMRRTRQW